VKQFISIENQEIVKEVPLTKYDNTPLTISQETELSKISNHEEQIFSEFDNVLDSEKEKDPNCLSEIDGFFENKERMFVCRAIKVLAEKELINVEEVVNFEAVYDLIKVVYWNWIKSLV
jgi:hypothetical protein